MIYDTIGNIVVVGGISEMHYISVIPDDAVILEPGCLINVDVYQGNDGEEAKRIFDYYSYEWRSMHNVTLSNSGHVIIHEGEVVHCQVMLLVKLVEVIAFTTPDMPNACDTYKIRLEGIVQ